MTNRLPKRTHYDVAVIGAGLIGVFSARALARKNISVCVLEKNSDVCTGISKANAAIVYSGYDVPPNTLKAQLCVPGCESFPALCRELGVRLNPCGSLLVCFGPEGEKTIRDRYTQGLQNGVKGLRLLSREETLALEPNLRNDVRLGLLAPNTCSVEPWELGIAAYENARKNGIEFLFETEVSAIARKSGCYRIVTDRGELEAGAVINCAGLQSAELRDTLLPPSIAIRTSVTDFCVFAKTDINYVNHIIFTETEDGKKGVTLIPTPDGKLMAESPQKTKTTHFLPTSTAKGQRELREKCRELVPALGDLPCIRSFAAVRPNPYDINDRNRHIGSFTVLDEDGFISLIGIKTPGMTSAPGLGQLAADKACAYLGITKDNSNYDPRRIAPVRLSALTYAERSAVVEKNPLYGRIVCRCGDISEGEVLDAIRAGAVTLDGVKRRCGTALGECQGDFCTARVAKLLADELGISVEEVLYRHD